MQLPEKIAGDESYTQSASGYRIFKNEKNNL